MFWANWDLKTKYWYFIKFWNVIACVESSEWDICIVKVDWKEKRAFHFLISSETLQNSFQNPDVRGWMTQYYGMPLMSVASSVIETTSSERSYFQNQKWQYKSLGFFWKIETESKRLQDQEQSLLNSERAENHWIWIRLEIKVNSIHFWKITASSQLLFKRPLVFDRDQSPRSVTFCPSLHDRQNGARPSRYWFSVRIFVLTLCKNLNSQTISITLILYDLVFFDSKKMMRMRFISKNKWFIIKYKTYQKLYFTSLPAATWHDSQIM